MFSLNHCDGVSRGHHVPIILIAVNLKFGIPYKLGRAPRQHISLQREQSILDGYVRTSSSIDHTCASESELVPYSGGIKQRLEVAADL